MAFREDAALKDNLKRLSHLLGDRHLAVADAWVSLGLSQLDTCEAEAAERSFLKALEIRSSILDESDETITQVHYYIGLSYYERGDYQKAQESYEKCLEIYERECRPEDSFLASVLDSLANLNHDRDKLPEAEVLLKRSLFIKLCVLDPFEPAIAESLNHLGWLYSQLGSFAKAENLFLCALDIWISAYGVEHANTALCLENYAFVLNKTGREAEALKLLSKVESIRSLG